MDILNTIKANTHWKNIISIKSKYKDVFYQPNLIKKEIQDIIDIYTDGSMSDYALVITEKYVYVGMIGNNQIICFGKLDTLEEACNAL